MVETNGGQDSRTTRDDVVTVTVHHTGEPILIETTTGRSLRSVLLEADLSPYTSLTAYANCGGRGICATCGVRVRDTTEPTHWHDRLADRFGYPRLSCQIVVMEDMTIELVEEKRVWGRREPKS